MAARGSKSKKRSAGKSVSRHERDPGPVFFVDKSLGAKVVPTALTAAGCRVEVLTDHFHPETEDALWIPQVGKRGWIILTKDRSIRSNQIEIAALMKSGTASFILSAANLSGPDMAAAFVTAILAMLRFIQKFPRPFVATVSRTGRVDLLLTHAGLLKKIE